MYTSANKTHLVTAEEVEVVVRDELLPFKVEDELRMALLVTEPETALEDEEELAMALLVSRVELPAVDVDGDEELSLLPLVTEFAFALGASALVKALTKEPTGRVLPVPVLPDPGFADPGLADPVFVDPVLADPVLAYLVLA